LIPTVEIIVELREWETSSVDVCLCSSGDKAHIRAKRSPPSPPESSPHYASHMTTLAP
jgi:hypothetical protein